MATTSKPRSASAEPRPYTTLAEYRTKAAEVRKEHGYEGKLTAPMLLALEPLLYEPIPAHYIKTDPPREGKPYETTGIRSKQVQVDRLSAVLGLPHWSELHQYLDGGSTCHFHLVIGNSLHLAELKEDGQLDARGADILVHREGRGSYNRSKNKGDLAKGSETNAAKRTIAKAGPGHEIYSNDLDEDALANATDAPAPRAERKAKAEAPPQTLAALIDSDKDLKELRQQITDGMRLYGKSDAAILTSLNSHTTKEDLEALFGRISMALDERDAEAK